MVVELLNTMYKEEIEKKIKISLNPMENTYRNTINKEHDDTKI